MSLYGVTEKGNVVQCPYNCNKRHQHYQGTYERALKFFGLSEEEPQPWGKLINVIMYHQTSDRTFPKLSNELFDILMLAQAEHKYWAPEAKREALAMEAIEEARRAGWIFDEELLERLKKSDRKASQDRVYEYERWMRSG